MIAGVPEYVSVLYTANAMPIACDGGAPDKMTDYAPPSDRTHGIDVVLKVGGATDQGPVNVGNPKPYSVTPLIVLRMIK